MYYFMRKMLSESILDLGKCPNQKMHESECACFQVGAFYEVIKYYIITVQKQLWSISAYI